MLPRNVNLWRQKSRPLARLPMQLSPAVGKHHLLKVFTWDANLVDVLFAVLGRCGRRLDGRHARYHPCERRIKSIPPVKAALRRAWVCEVT